MKGDVESYYEAGQWKTKVEGNQQASHTHDQKEEAVAKGREMAVERGVEHFIRNMDGTIGERHTYPRSRDPRNIPADTPVGVPPSAFPRRRSKDRCAPRRTS
ncbi:DUF2188 domain-containing protein [Amycolatopsis sp. NPDC051373]|uniref:DUF2188 domain-containing protein n=1 Tax=Amycolatopsis sp. NPDC051373 TaxID=3155801 RepID=UPI00344D25A9